MIRVGLIGVGIMGQGIAFNLVTKGFPVALLDHPGNQPLDELTAAGARVCASLSEIAEQASVIILCVTGAPEVEAILSGAGGLAERLGPGSIVIDCSTSLPSTTLRMAALLQDRGAAFLDAPMTRLAKEAREGRLNLLVGGDPEVLAAVRPVLQAFAENITLVGPVGAGHRMKLLHNYVSLGFMTLLAEAAAHAATAGVDAETFVDVLEKGGGAGAALKRLTPPIVSGATDSVPFAVGNALKDIRYYLQMARDMQVSSGVAEAVAEALSQQADAGFEKKYMSDLVALMRAHERSARN
ncbi:MAG: NAD(P)-dependent oxidoreductase [Burkholderiaceae bacterium]|jgi:3-hydroxyisobutyrate dehydrogenase